ncbi:MAG: hypothetical protein [Bacteriophage sp.]|nr:MAG: hypothetical protein [Bacteriophage sp.]
MSDLPLASQFNDPTVTEGDYKAAFVRLLDVLGGMKAVTDQIEKNTLATTAIYDAVQKSTQAVLNSSFVSGLKNTYTIPQMDTMLAAKATATDVYTKTQIDTKFLNVYNTTQVDTMLSNKADISALTATNTTVATKANAADVYTKTQTLQASEINALFSGFLSDIKNGAKLPSMVIAVNQQSDLASLQTWEGRAVIVVGSGVYTFVSGNWVFQPLAISSIAGLANSLSAKVDAGTYTNDINTINTAIATKANSADVYAKLDTVKVVYDYTALTALVSPANGQVAYVSKSGLAGKFIYRLNDTQTPNGGTVIASTGGGNWLRLYDGIINVQWFGIIGDSTGVNSTGTDNTTAINNLLTWMKTTLGIYKPKLFFPSGIYRVTNSILITFGVEISGVAPSQKSLGGGDFGSGSFIYFDHLNRGIVISDTVANVYFAGVRLEKFCFIRNKPEPVDNTWAPYLSDWDIYGGYGADDITLRDLMFYGTRYGVRLDGIPAHGTGRLEIYNLKGHFFEYGIVVATAYDVVRIDQVHIWPFWRDSDYVHAYTLAHLTGIYFERNDNPLLSNIFTIYCACGLYLSNGATGTPSKIHLANADFDRGKWGIILGNTATNVTGYFSNISYQSENINSNFPVTTGGFLLIDTNCTGSRLQFSNVDIAIATKEAILIKATNSNVSFANLRINGWSYTDKANPTATPVNAYAFNLASGATVTVTGALVLENSNGYIYNGHGTLISQLWQDTSTNPTYGQFSVGTPASSTTALSVVNSRHRVKGSTVEMACDFTCTPANDGTHILDKFSVSAPYGVITKNRPATAVDMTTGKAYTAFCNAATNKIEIYPVGATSFTTAVNITLFAEYDISLNGLYIY